MTLIACLHPRQCRTLLGDILISSNEQNDGDLVVPTRVYIEPGRLHGMSWKPAGFCRKVIEVTPELAILWAGKYDEACRLARYSKEWFRRERPTCDNVRQLLEAHYPVSPQEFAAIIASASENWLYKLGDVQKADSSSYGEYFVSGTGTIVLRALVDEAQHREGMPDQMTLWLANDLMAREIATADTIYSKFGAAYEVLYRDRAGFQRVDDVMHVFVHVYMGDDQSIQSFKLYPHLIRQWYEDQMLYVASLSFTEDSQQGLASRGFIVSSVLGEIVPPKRPAEALATQPKYLCIHHQFIESKIPRSSCILRGEAIDKYFKLSKEESGVKFEFTSSYREMLTKLPAAAAGQVIFQNRRSRTPTQ